MSKYNEYIAKKEKYETAKNQLSNDASGLDMVFHMRKDSTGDLPLWVNLRRVNISDNIHDIIVKVLNNNQQEIKAAILSEIFSLMDNARKEAKKEAREILGEIKDE